jgi:hypothetical protein
MACRDSAVLKCCVEKYVLCHFCYGFAVTVYYPLQAKVCNQFAETDT